MTDVRNVVVIISCVVGLITMFGTAWQMITALVTFGKKLQNIEDTLAVVPKLREDVDSLLTTRKVDERVRASLGEHPNALDHTLHAPAHPIR